MHDLNTTLANMARSWANKAEKCEQAAARFEEQAAHWDRTSTIGGLGETERRKAEQEKARAVVWRKRAEVASEGYLYHDPRDMTFALENQELVGECIRQSRVRYLETPGRSNELLDNTPSVPGPAGAPSWGAMEKK